MYADQQEDGQSGKRERWTDGNSQTDRPTVQYSWFSLRVQTEQWVEGACEDRHRQGSYRERKTIRETVDRENSCKVTAEQLEDRNRWRDSQWDRQSSSEQLQRERRSDQSQSYRAAIWETDRERSQIEVRPGKRCRYTWETWIALWVSEFEYECLSWFTTRAVTGALSSAASAYVRERRTVH